MKLQYVRYLIQYSENLDGGMGADFNTLKGSRLAFTVLYYKCVFFFKLGFLCNACIQEKCKTQIFKNFIITQP